MKRLCRVCLVLGVTLALGIGGAFIGGCFGPALAPDKAAKVESLVNENIDLGKQIDQLTKDAKAGKLDPMAVLGTIESLRAQMDKNVEAVKAIHAEAVAAGATAGGIAGSLLRTGLHGAQAVLMRFPIGGWAGIAVNGLLTLLLGGSSSKKAELPPVVKA